MDQLSAFQRLWASEGNAGRAAALLGYAFVVRLAGWEALAINPDKKHGARDAFKRAGVDPGGIDFLPAGAIAAEPLTPGEIEGLRRGVEREFGTLAVNMRGHLYKKSGEWRDRRRRQHHGEDDEDGDGNEGT